MANAVKALYDALVTCVCTLTSLANGAGRICTEVDNTTLRATRCLVALRFKTGGSAPTVNSVVKVYLIRHSGDTAQGLQGGQLGASGPGTSDAAVTVEPINAPCVLAIQVDATTGKFYAEVSEPILEPGAKFSFLVWNAIGNALSSTASDHVLECTLIVDEIQ